MKNTTTPRRSRYLAWAALSVSAVALACATITVPPPATPVRVTLSNLIAHGFNNAAVAAIGERMQSMYGNQHNASEVMAYVAVQGPIGQAAVIVPFTKPCNERYDEQGREVTTPPRSGGGGGGGISFPRFPYIPGGCVGNCGGTVEVGEVAPA